ncbi:MAG TPA: hypothetical protein VMF86_02320 [Stellaceae bacterium]|nr:hypothetical protein [Stellaceae bacterium]
MADPIAAKGRAHALNKRRSQALRANLRRRKAQANARAAASDRAAAPSAPAAAAPDLSGVEHSHKSHPND